MHISRKTLTRTALIFLSSLGFAGIQQLSAYAAGKLPFQPGVSLNLTRINHGAYPPAMDFARNQNGIEIRASLPGVVEVAGYENTSGGSCGYGNFVRIKYDNGEYGVYAHLRDLPVVTNGQRVAQGAKLGIMGTTGCSTGIHVHYERRRNRNQSSSYIPTFDEVPNGLVVGAWYTSQNSGGNANNPPTSQPIVYQKRYQFGDLDTDGRSNITWRQNTSTWTWAIDESGTNTNQPAIQMPNTSGWNMVGYAKLTSPNWGSNENMVFQKPNNGTTVFWVNNPNGTYHSTNNLPNTQNWELLDSVENVLGLDGLLWKKNDGSVHLWRFENNQYKDSIILPQMNDWVYLGTGKLRSDNNTHILWRRKSDSKLAFWHIDSNGTFVGTTWINQHVDGEWKFTAIGKFNTINSLDNLVWTRGQDTRLWHMSNSGQYSSYTILPDTSGWDSLGVGKFRNNDPKENLVWKNASGDTLHWIFNNNGTYGNATNFSNTNGWTHK